LLSPVEHQLFETLKGDLIKKVRYYHNYSGNAYSLDVFEGELEGLLLSEVSADSLEQLMSIEPPAFSSREVTEDEYFDGGNLCKISQSDLKAKLDETFKPLARQNFE
jgi:adenylate cyclase